jgi:RNA recognition motif-containing protein
MIMKKMICAGVVAALLSSGAFATLHVSNLPFSMGDDGLIDLFSEYGEVESAHVIMDRQTGQSKGFGFVTLSSDQEEQLAIDALNEVKTDGHVFKVKKAPEQPSRPSRRSSH